jgi:hypothetical protein
MENYFYVDGSNVVRRDLQNALPGCTPLLQYDSFNYRNIGLDSGKTTIGYCPPGTLTNGSIEYNPTSGSLADYTIPTDHHLLTETVEGEFTVQL